MKRIAFGALAALAGAAALVLVTASSASEGAKEWQVTITNLTPPGSQPLSPPLFVVHSTQVDIWSVGDLATAPVARIAEDADNSRAEGGAGRGGELPAQLRREVHLPAKGFHRVSEVLALPLDVVANVFGGPASASHLPSRPRRSSALRRSPARAPVESPS